MQELLTLVEVALLDKNGIADTEVMQERLASITNPVGLDNKKSQLNVID